MDTPDPSPQSDPPDKSTVAKHDDSGRSGGVARSVLANGAWYAVVVVSGFVVPRLIADYRGQPLPGIWDLGWSLVVYVSFLAFGITSAVNRYVARYRTTFDWESLNSIAGAANRRYQFVRAALTIHVSLPLYRSPSCA